MSSRPPQARVDIHVGLRYEHVQRLRAGAGQAVGTGLEVARHVNLQRRRLIPAGKEWTGRPDSRQLARAETAHATGEDLGGGQ